MRKFIIALEVDLNDLEAKSPELWLKRSMGSVVMRKIGDVKIHEVNEDSGVRVPTPKPKPKPKARTKNEKV